MQKSVIQGNPLVGASIGAGLKTLKFFHSLNLGNVVLCGLPDSREEAAELLTYCRDNKIYIMISELVHRHNHERWHAPSLDKKTVEELIPLAGEYFLGRYAIGEAGGILYWPKFYTINEAVHAYPNMPPAANDAEARHNYVEYLKKELAFERDEVADCKLFNVDSSVVFATHTEAGIDGQCLEMLPGDPLITLSAVRGAARSANQNWGVHIAQMYYGGIHCDEMYMRRWRASLWLSFMAGAQFIYPECGHFKYQISLEPFRDFNDPLVRRFRDELRELYRYTLIHRRPAGFPQSPMAIVRGRDDGHPGIWNPYAWGIYECGEAWEYSDADKAWEMYNTFFTRAPLFASFNTGEYDCSGNPPGGQLDMIPPDGDFSSYRTLMFLGTNRMDEELYGKLINFVKNGGHLIIALSHFDNSPVRGGEKITYFRDGKIRDLCGFDIAGRGKSDVYGISVIRQCSDPRYDLPMKHPGRDPNFNGRVTAMALDNLAPETTILAGLRDTARDFTGMSEFDRKPLLVEHRLGKGLVLTITAGEAPGSFGLREFVNMLIWSSLRVHRTDVDFLAGDRIRYAVYDDHGNQKFYLYNSDPDLPSGVQLLYQGKKYGSLILNANEFKAGWVSDKLIFIPADPLWEAENCGNDTFRFISRAQTVNIINTGNELRQITVNGQTISIAPEEGGALTISADIPADKAAFFSDDFMEEPVVEVTDASTPY
ncbi:MAG: hypothetical protein E7058_09645 [Lentisphaerae bacterium]|nr:hypothetical protein [Lentisphaerota bacterium]